MTTLRRALFRWQLFAVPVLPLWLLVGFGLFGSGAGAFFLVFFGAVVLFVFLGALAGLTRLRPAVRETRALGGWDAAATMAFHLAVVGLGFFGAFGPAFGIAAVVFGLCTFWLTVGGLVREWRGRVVGAVARASAGSGFATTARGALDDGEIVVVREPRR